MRALLLLLLALVAGCGGCASFPRPDVKSYALRLEFEGGVCSGTATGQQELLTAAHCMSGAIGDLIAVNGIPVDPVRYDIGEPENGDAVRVHFYDHKFKVWSKRTGKPRQGDRIRWHGNPLGAPDMLREGYVSGVADGLMVIAAATCVGDSGSGIFNDRDELIGVVSRIPTEKCSPFVLAVVL